MVLHPQAPLRLDEPEIAKRQRLSSSTQQQPLKPSVATRLDRPLESSASVRSPASAAIPLRQRLAGATPAAQPPAQQKQTSLADAAPLRKVHFFGNLSSVLHDSFWVLFQTLVEASSATAATVLTGALL